nr:putative GTP diphosphokinase RSH1, chloroplastic [Tanacetum cinerariifolium]
MASSAQSMSRVAVECVNNTSICKFGSRWDGAISGRYDCGGIWCVSKPPLIMVRKYIVTLAYVFVLSTPARFFIGFVILLYRALLIRIASVLSYSKIFGAT